MVWCFSLSRNMKGVLAILGCSLAIFWPGALTFGFPGVMTPIWQEMFSVGNAATGATIFFMLVAVGVFMFLVGRWQERYGIRKMISLGVALTAFASVVAVYAQSIYMIYAWAFLNGIASSFVYIPALTLVQLWHPHKRGLASGAVSMVFGLSAAIISPLFGKLLLSLGYSSMNFSIAILTLVTGLVGAYLARPPDMKAASSVESSPDEARGSHPARWDLWTRSFTVQECLRTQSFWFLWITWTLAGAAGVSMSILATVYGISRGFGLESSVLILMAFNFTNGTGRIISGFVSDKIGRNRTMCMAFFAAGIAYLALSWAGNLTQCALLAAVVGFAFGTLFSVSAPLVAESFGLKHFGAIFGLTFAAYGFVAGPLGPTLSGYVLDVTNGNFVVVFLYLGIFYLISGFCIRMVTPMLR